MVLTHGYWDITKNPPVFMTDDPSKQCPHCYCLGLTTYDQGYLVCYGCNRHYKYNVYKKGIKSLFMIEGERT